MSQTPPPLPAPPPPLLPVLARPWALLPKLWAAMFAEERLLIGIIVVAVLACLATGTGFSFDPVTGYQGLFMANMGGVIVLSRLIFLWRRWRPSPNAWFQGINFEAEFGLVRATIFLIAYLTIYSNLKARIPAFNDNVWDEQLANFERAIMGGFDLVAWARGAQQWPDFIMLLDETYHHGYIFMAWLMMVLYLNHGPRHVRFLVTSMGVLYLAGVVLTAIWPTRGPCFIERDAYTWMREQDTSSWGSQQFLLKALNRTENALAKGTWLEAKAFTGIAALPSLHVGHCVLLIIFAAMYAPRMNIVLVPITAITWVATIVFGWHYLMDGVVAIPMVFGSVWVARKLVFGAEPWTRYDPPPAG